MKIFGCSVPYFITILMAALFGAIFFNFIGTSRPKEIEARNQFLLYEMAKMNENQRLKDLEQFELDTQQTLDSFEYQWANLQEGFVLPDDEAFIAKTKSQICTMTGLPPEWFNGKKVIDIGCGLGRYTYGLLLLGAEVTACDASSSALANVIELGKPFGSRLHVIQANILKDPLPIEEYDMAFSFGVVHHTGNTYYAINKVCQAAKKNGKVFLMVYGYPETLGDFRELNEYEALRNELRPLNFEEKVRLLRTKFPEEQVHGWFDAVSPRINDLLTYGELVEVLGSFGVTNVRRTVKNRNLHVVGDKL